MPKVIEGITYYTRAEIYARWREGFEDGSTKTPHRGYSKSDLEKARNHLLISATDQAFTAGRKEGHSIVNHAKIRSDFQAEIAAASEQSHKIGYEKGQAAAKAAGSQVFNAGKEKARKEILMAFESEKSEIARSAVNDFFHRGGLDGQNNNYVMRKIRRILKPIYIQPELMPIVNGQRLAPPLRLSHFRYQPLSVTSRFALAYVIMPLAYSALFSVIPYALFRIHKEEKLHKEVWLKEQEEKAKSAKEVEENRAKEDEMRAKEEEKREKSRWDHGETRDQYFSRQLVKTRCKTIQALTPEELNQKEFTLQQAKLIADSIKDCQGAAVFHKEMKLTMKVRRGTENPPPKYYGLRDNNFYQDRARGFFHTPEIKILIVTRLAERLDKIILASKGA